MKKAYLLSALFANIFFLPSCKKEEKIAIDQLNGKWVVANDDPNLVVDGSVSYTFGSRDNCIKNVYDALANQDTAIYRTYVISYDHTLVTLFDEEHLYTEQYRITKLTGEEMKWENASPADGNTNKRLVRSKLENTLPL